MQIFEQEKQDGLEETIKAQASVTYACLVEKGSDNTFSASQKKELKTVAGLKDKDLYYTQSILVTTSWNKNDDVFDKEEVWAARNTPVHKPTNLEHDENSIVGHITANWPITEEGILIDEKTPVENLPEKFHILTSSVIYEGFTDPELKSRADNLIQEIENGTKYVSMECFFNGFDYGLVNKSTGEFKVLARDESTAFLTKHLRSYGGAGEHEDYKIGRVLRNITFSGKGFVNKPANPESIIFTKDSFPIEEEKTMIEKNSSLEEIGVFSNQANIKEAVMSSEQETKPENKVEAMNDCTDLVKEAYASRDEIKTQASELEVALEAERVAHAETKTALETALTEKEEAAKMSEEDMKKKKEEMEKMKAELDAANEILAAYKDKEEEMKKKEAMMKRKASLLEAGLDEESAASNVEKFESLDDEAFDNMVSLLAAMKPKMPSSEDDVKEEKKEGKKKASEDLSEVLETAEPENNVDLSVGSEAESDIENTRAALVDFISNRLGKTLNK
jgi:hypothetical protein